LPFDDLRQWIARWIEPANSSASDRIDPILEIAEITDRVSKSKTGKPGGSAYSFKT